MKLNFWLDMGLAVVTLCAAVGFFIASLFHGGWETWALTMCLATASCYWSDHASKRLGEVRLP